ncbi:integrase [Vibrio diabolicus]|uniref:integrase n=1 Tax=Vibrio diabolicus TaxID=50719 RepID=UPI00375347CE
MADVLVFKPKHELQYEKNLSDFIELGRRIAPLNTQYDYDKHYWKGVGNFTIFGANSRQRNRAQLMLESLLPFAKAYVIYGGGGKSRLDAKFKALRAINGSWVKQYPNKPIDVTKLCERDFTQAAEVAKDALSEGADYQAGKALSDLHKFLTESKLISRFPWKNPIRKPLDNSTDENADKRREDKMPDENALMALAEISSRDAIELSARDLFTTSTMTLLFAAPNRGSEPFYLRYDCEHAEKMSANKALEIGLERAEIERILVKKKSPFITIEESGNVLNDSQLTDKSPFHWDAEIELKGLKWYSGKGYLHAHKWLPSVMYDAVEIAIKRLLSLSKRARHFAMLLEESSDFPRHELCPDVPEEQLLTMNEAALALGLDVYAYGDLTDPKIKKKMRTSRNQFLKRKHIARKDFQVCLRDLNKIVRDNLPEGFPYIPFTTGEGNVKVKWSESLYANFSNCFSSQKATIYTELHIPTIDTLNEDLAPTKKKNKKTGEAVRVLSIFQRWRYGCLVITSHQLRHMLDTMAAVNGMDGEMRAKWAMRSDPKHNRYYDHTTPEEYGADFIEATEAEDAKSYPKESSLKVKKVQVQVATPRNIQELNTRASLTAHTTEFGMCIQSYLSEPCHKYRDCLNCNEHVCEKGDDGKCERIRQRLKNEKRLLKMDEKAVNDGVQGAIQWYERRKLTMERGEELLTMLEDPSIPNGSLIKLTNIEDVSLLDRAMDANGKKRLPKIENFKRIKVQSKETNQVTSVTVDQMIGIQDKPFNKDCDSEDSDLNDLLDDMDFEE